MYSVGSECSRNALFISQCYPQRPRNEGLAYDYPGDTDESFVPFTGADSTLKHLFGLVFEFMDYLNLRGYLENNQEAVVSELVRDHTSGIKALFTGIMALYV